jgi:hypothetical protein
MIPSNFVSLHNAVGYLKFANDNFDMVEETLSWKGTLHVSQVVAFRRLIPRWRTNAEDEVTIGVRTRRAIRVREVRVPQHHRCDDK